MRRRDFILLVGGTVAWPLGVHAQQAAGKFHRIGILSPERPPPGLLEDFRQGLLVLGYVEGRNISIEIQSAEDGQQLPALATKLVALKVDLILAINTPAVQAAKKATGKIPIVMTRVADPVKSGLVPSLSRPGGNITGVSFMTDELGGKRLELLKEAVPGISRVAVLWNERNAGSTIVVDQLKAPSQKLGLELVLLPIQDPSYLFATFQAAKAGRVQAVIIIDDAVITGHSAEVFKLAAKHSLPVMSQFKSFTAAGGFMSYGASTPVIYQRAAYYVDQILKGANPGELPIEQPTKFELVINLKTAKALGLTIPQSLLLRADEVIE